MKNKMLTKTISCLVMAWGMSASNAVAQDVQNCELFCQYMGISPSSFTSIDPQEIEQYKMNEMQTMVVNFRQMKKERKADKMRRLGGLLVGIAGVMMQEQENKHQQKQQMEQDAMASVQQSQAAWSTNDARPRETSRPYADNSLTSRQNNNQQYYPVGTTSNGQLESARQLENIAIANGQSRYVSESEMQQRKAQNEGTTVMGVELTSSGRISHTLKVDYSRDIPRVNAVRYNNPQNPSMDAWQYLYIDAQPNRAGTPKECKWYVTVYNRVIYF